MKQDDRKRQLKAQFKAAQRTALEASLPIPLPELKGLLDHLDETAHTCDHTFYETTKFLVERGVDPARVLPWLQEHGGYCDCEVLANVESDLDELLRRETDA